ncbi:Lrp/AsnC family transcriptional regulator [Aquitalea sp. LB_tupeE]|nr:Lrp/AsnC family transcriptional regulator [Aquitalea sp. LB_tupeE]
MEIDPIDKSILNELVNDARISLSNLSRKIGISRQAVKQRIDRLEQNKIITGYTAKLSALDNKRMVDSIFLVYRKDRMRGADVTSAISKIAEVTNCVVLSGDVDLMVQVRADSHARINEIWSFISSIAGVQNITTCFVLSTVVSR